MSKYISFCSGGNDSIAMIQYLYEMGKKDIIVAYNNTGWSAKFWAKRMESIKILSSLYGYKYVEIKSKGFINMVRNKKGFPMAASKMSFCTQELKTKPTYEWLKYNDPEKKLICCAGVRREESQHRSNHPEFIYDSDLYEKRLRWFPIVKLKISERDNLIKKAGFEILSHSSMECFPCINSNRADFRLLSKYPEKIKQIESLENEMGYTSKGKPRLMFRPYRHMGAYGIREVVKWGLSERGKYKRNNKI